MVALTRFWILLSAVLVSAGWILSALHQLNKAGYGITLALVAGGVYICRRKHGHPTCENLARESRKIVRRLRRPLPLLYFVLAGLSLLTGLLYVLVQYDSDSYRIPRIWHWLGNEQWHWIHTDDIRMNIAASGFEWLCAPLMLFTGSDRGIFLINWISYLLMPGLTYSVFIRLGVSRRVAWWWMWLLPSGWCYVFQAQSTVNDSFAVIYALATVAFALRARQTKDVTDWWLAILSAALLTGAKQTDLPLALVLSLALWPGIRMMRARPLQLSIVVAVGLLISALPVTVFNLRHMGSWMGTSNAPNGWGGTVLHSPFWGVIGSTFSLTIQNLKPPVFPLNETWNAAMDRFVRTRFGLHFQCFESFGHLRQATTVDTAALGMAVTTLALVSLAWAWRYRTMRQTGPAIQTAPLIYWLRIAPWLALLVFMSKVGAYASGRQLAPYYVFLFPILLVAPGQACLVQRKWWQRVSVSLVMVTVLMLAGSRQYPMFPAQTTLGWLHRKHPQSHAIASLMARFADANHGPVERYGIVPCLPPGEKDIGYFCQNCSVNEPGLWVPFGSRRVERISPDDPPDYLLSLPIQYVVVDGFALNNEHETIDEWLRKFNADLVADVSFSPLAAVQTQHVYLARLHRRPAG